MRYIPVNEHDLNWQRPLFDRVMIKEHSPVYHVTLRYKDIRVPYCRPREHPDKQVVDVDEVDGRELCDNCKKRIQAKMGESVEGIN